MNKSARERITSAYYSLTSTEKRAADFILEKSAQVKYMSITELAREAGVSEASISRFCRTLGFGGFNAFKLELAMELPDPPKSASSPQDGDISAKILAENEQALKRTHSLIDPQAIDRAVDIISGARKICCMGQGGSLFTAQEAFSVFSTVSSRFVCVQDSHLQSAMAALLCDRDAVMYFSYSGATRAALDVLPIVRGKGVKVILFTRYRLSPAAGYADVVLQCGADESPMQLGSVAARICQLYLVDVLLAAFCQRDPERAQRNREEIARALNIMHL